MSVRHLDLGADPERSGAEERHHRGRDASICTAASFSDVDSLRGTVSLDAPRIVAAGFAANQVKANARIDGRRLAIDGQAAAYGASATAAGSVVLPGGRQRQPVAFDLHGQARARRPAAPAPRAERSRRQPPTSMASYHVSRRGIRSDVGSGSHAGLRRSGCQPDSGDLRFAPSTIAGATHRVGQHARLRDERQRDRVRRPTRRSPASNLQRVGERIPRAGARGRPLQELDQRPRRRERPRRRRSTGRMSVTASGTLHDTSILGGRIPQLAFDAAIAAGHGARQGQRLVRRLRSGGRQRQAGAEGHGRRHARRRCDGRPTSRTASRRTASRRTATIDLEPSTIGGLDITRAAIDGDYRRLDRRHPHLRHRRPRPQRAGERHAGAQRDGPVEPERARRQPEPGADRQAGEPADRRHRQDRCDDHRQQAASCRPRATLVGGNGVKYGDNGALVGVERLHGEGAGARRRAARACRPPRTRTFVTVAGQNINELTATTDYANQQVDLRCDRETAAAGAGGRRLARPASRSSGSAPAAALARDAGD